MEPTTHVLPYPPQPSTMNTLPNTDNKIPQLSSSNYGKHIPSSSSTSTKTGMASSFSPTFNDTNAVSVSCSTSNGSVTSSTSFGALLSPSPPLPTSHPVPSVPSISIPHTVRSSSSSSSLSSVTNDKEPSTANVAAATALSSSASSSSSSISSLSSSYPSKDGGTHSPQFQSPNHTTAQFSNTSGPLSHNSNNTHPTSSRLTNSGNRIVLTPKTEFTRFPTPGDTNFTSKINPSSSSSTTTHILHSSSRLTPSNNALTSGIGSNNNNGNNMTPLRITPVPVVSSVPTTIATSTGNPIVSPSPPLGNRVLPVTVLPTITPRQPSTQHHSSLLDTIKVPTPLNDSFTKEKENPRLSEINHYEEEDKEDTDGDDGLATDGPRMDDVTTDTRHRKHNPSLSSSSSSSSFPRPQTTVPTDESSLLFSISLHNNATNLTMLRGGHDENSLGPMGSHSMQEQPFSSSSGTLTTFSSAMFTSHGGSSLPKRSSQGSSSSSSSFPHPLPSSATTSTGSHVFVSATSTTENRAVPSASTNMYTEDTMHTFQHNNQHHHNTDTRLSFFNGTNTMFPESNTLANAIPLHHVLGEPNTNTMMMTTFPPSRTASSSGSSSSSSSLLSSSVTSDQPNPKEITFSSSSVQLPLRIPSGASFLSDTSITSNTSDVVFPSLRTESVNPLAIRVPSSSSTVSTAAHESSGQVSSSHVLLPGTTNVDDHPILRNLSNPNSTPKPPTLNSKFKREAKALGLYVNPNNELPHTLLMMDHPRSFSSSVPSTGHSLLSVDPLLNPSFASIQRNPSTGSTSSVLASEGGPSLALAALMCPPKRECVRKRERENDAAPKFQQYSRNLLLEQQKQKQAQEEAKKEATTVTTPEENGRAMNTTGNSGTSKKSKEKTKEKLTGREESSLLPTIPSGIDAGPTNTDPSNSVPTKKKKIILRTTETLSSLANSSTVPSTPTLSSNKSDTQDAPVVTMAAVTNTFSALPSSVTTTTDTVTEITTVSVPLNSDASSLSAPAVSLPSASTTIPSSLPPLPLPDYIVLRPHKPSLRTFITRVYGEDKSELRLPFRKTNPKNDTDDTILSASTSASAYTVSELLDYARQYWLTATDKMQTSLSTPKNGNGGTDNAPSSTRTETDILFLLHCAYDQKKAHTMEDSAPPPPSRLIALPTAISVSDTCPSTVVSPNLVLVSGTSYAYLHTHHRPTPLSVLHTSFPSSLLMNGPWPSNAVKRNPSPDTATRTTMTNNSKDTTAATVKLRAYVEAPIMKDIPVKDLYYHGAFHSSSSGSSTTPTNMGTDKGTLSATDSVVIYYDFFPLQRSDSSIEPENIPINLPIEPIPMDTNEATGIVTKATVPIHPIGSVSASTAVRSTDKGSTRNDGTTTSTTSSTAEESHHRPPVSNITEFLHTFDTNITNWLQSLRTDDTTQSTRNLPSAFMDQVRFLTDQYRTEVHRYAGTWTTLMKNTSATIDTTDDTSSLPTDQELSHNHAMLPPTLKRRITPVLAKDTLG